MKTEPLSEKFNLVLDHVKGEIALCILDPKSNTKKYRKHIAKELQKLAQQLQK